MTASTDRPNIVLIITDQQRWDTIRALGADHMTTPNLDRLAREGVSFSRMYVNAPSCAPSRASLFTGLSPHTTGVFKNEDVWRHSWVEHIADAGYHCASIGKMHTYPYRAAVGFHERHVMENKDRGHPALPFLLDDWDKALWTHGVVKPDRRSLRDRQDYDQRLGAFVWDLAEELHADNFVGDLACHWLDSYPSRADEPFFLQIGFLGPHPPYDAVPRWIDAYADRDLPIPISSEEDLEAQPAALKALRQEHVRTDHDSVVHNERPTAEQSRRRRAHYAANISMIDEQLGSIMDALDRRGVLDDTVIVFTSDHGDALGDHGHSQKWTMYEGSVRVPAIVWAPGRIQQDVVTDSLASLFDLGPTMLEFAGVPVPPWMEARSLMPELVGEGSAGREMIFSEHARDMILQQTALMTMVRDESWKLVEFIDSDEGQLFNLVHDPDERQDLWDDPAHVATRTRLQRAISTWRAESALRSAGWAELHR